MSKILINTRQYMADGTEIHVFYTHGLLSDLGSTAAHLWITGQTDDKFFTPIVQPIGNDILGAINKIIKRVLEAEAKANAAG